MNEQKTPLTEDRRISTVIKLSKLIKITTDKLVLTDKMPALLNDFKEINTTILIANLDVASVLKTYLEMLEYPLNKSAWEGIIMFKYLYLSVFESHNKIAYKRFVNDDGSINLDKTENNKKASLWYSLIESYKDRMTDSEIDEYHYITIEMDDFSNENDWSYITKIRNRTGHYGDILNYAKDVEAINADKVVNICKRWSEIMFKASEFASKLFLRLTNELINNQK